MWQYIVRMVERLHLKQRSQSEFSWGVDYLTSNRVESSGNYLASFVDYALEHSDEFFAYHPVVEFVVHGDQLTFSSPCQYPNIAFCNAKAHARVFPARSAKKAVIVVPHWTARAQSYVSLCRALSQFGFTAIRLTLPYHESRAEVSDWQTANNLVSANIGRTIQSVRQAVIEVRALADWLGRLGYTSVGVFGSSIGSCISILADAHDANIKSMFAAHISSCFGDVVWTGASTRHVKNGLEHHVSQEQIRRYWSVISPLPYIKHFAGTDPAHFIIAGEHDPTFLYSLTERVFLEYERWAVPLSKNILPIGHFTLRYGPFKYYLFKLILEHFRRTL